MPESPCQKMLRDKAFDDRVVQHYPRPFLPEASPYRKVDFDQEVMEVLKSDRSIRLGLKIAKVVIVGDVGVGKTCIVNRFCHEVFDAHYKATIGVDFEVERFDILNTPFNLQIWDTAGQDRFKCIAVSYYRNAHVVMVAFDLSNIGSLQNVRTWLDETLKSNKERPLVFLVGTKRDALVDAAYNVIERQAVQLARALQAEYWVVSSKTGENVREMFLRIATLSFNEAILRELESSDAKEVSKDFVKLQKTPSKKQKPKCVCRV